MARNGITQGMVKQAISRLQAANTPVTVDAVRAELGHTGSKTMICRLMNELEQAPLVEGNAQLKMAHDSW